jgi:hypothetical protein
VIPFPVTGFLTLSRILFSESSAHLRTLLPEVIPPTPGVFQGTTSFPGLGDGHSIDGGPLCSRTGHSCRRNFRCKHGDADWRTAQRSQRTTHRHSSDSRRARCRKLAKRGRPSASVLGRIDTEEPEGLGLLRTVFSSIRRSWGWQGSRSSQVFMDAKSDYPGTKSWNG